MNLLEGKGFFQALSLRVEGGRDGVADSGKVSERLEALVGEGNENRGGLENFRGIRSGRKGLECGRDCLQQIGKVGLLLEQLLERGDERSGKGSKGGRSEGPELLKRRDQG